MIDSIYVAISNHGFGHVAQTAPVVNRIADMNPDLKVWIRWDGPLEFLRSQFCIPFVHIKTGVDVGMVMADSLDVLPEESMEAYLKFHMDWPRKIDREAEHLKLLRPDLVLANVPYAVIAAAAAAGIPVVAMCSLNWADILYHYCREMGAVDQIVVQMVAAYNQAEVFLRPTPGMTMKVLNNVHAIGPIAVRGEDRRTWLLTQLGLDPCSRFIFVSFGGIPTEIFLDQWPALPDFYWLLPDKRNSARKDMVCIDSVGMKFIDAMCSSAVLLTKPGYGNFVNAACNDIPVLYIGRKDWPEERYLTHWLHRNCKCLEIDREVLEKGVSADMLDLVLGQPQMLGPEPAGIEEAVDIIAVVGSTA